MWCSTSSSRRPPKSSAPARPPLSPRSTLTGVLRINQFCTKNSSSTTLQTHPQEPKPEAEDAAVQLNKDLIVLANFFPDLKLEVLREVLRRFDGDSRLLVSVEQLYRYKAEWAKGRTQVPPRELDEDVPVEELFRTEEYRNAVARLLYRDFNGLNKSAVDAVLAEVNHAYLKARPVCQQIANKSWRATLQGLLFRRKKDAGTLPGWMWERGPVDQRLITTGSAELDRELEDVFVTPVRREQEASREEQDYKLASELNEKQARQAEALYECQICYSDVPFENVSACTEEPHTICLDCVRKSLNEAIYGQNWAQSVDPERASLKCLAPLPSPCPGHITSLELKSAILLDKKTGSDLWTKFEKKLAEQALLQSGLKFERCPFCDYAEATPTYLRHTSSTNRPETQHLTWHFRPLSPAYLLLTLIFLPAILTLALLLRLLSPTYTTTLLSTSISHLAEARTTPVFQCKNSLCKRKSCTRCQKPWHNSPTPHSCTSTTSDASGSTSESLLQSLRQSIETARTLAIKRVCPRCGTSFIKSSGCNKLTCTCGYSMCYLCRKNIGRTGDKDVDGAGADVGYRHFCEHFRPTGGKCTVCEKCELYREVEEDREVRKAGEEAERRWREEYRVRVEEGVGKDVDVRGRGGDRERERDGEKDRNIERERMKEIEKLRVDHDGIVGRFEEVWWMSVLRGEWTVQGIVDWAVEKAVVVKVD